MTKKKEKKVNVLRKPKHSHDKNRKNESSAYSRSAAYVCCLKIYKTKPECDRKGKVFKNDLQSHSLSDTRIQPDPRWFRNTRVVSQKVLEIFREEFQSRMSNNYNVILKERKLSWSLLNDYQKVGKST